MMTRVLSLLLAAIRIPGRLLMILRLLWMLPEIVADIREWHKEVQEIGTEVDSMGLNGNSVSDVLAEHDSAIDQLNMELGEVQTTAETAADLAKDLEKQCEELNSQVHELETGG